MREIKAHPVSLTIQKTLCLEQNLLISVLLGDAFGEVRSVGVNLGDVRSDKHDEM